MIFYFITVPIALFLIIYMIFYKSVNIYLKMFFDTKNLKKDIEAVKLLKKFISENKDTIFYKNGKYISVNTIDKAFPCFANNYDFFSHGEPFVFCYDSNKFNFFGKSYSCQLNDFFKIKRMLKALWKKNKKKFIGFNYTRYVNEMEQALSNINRDFRYAKNNYVLKQRMRQEAIIEKRAQKKRETKKIYTKKRIPRR